MGAVECFDVGIVIDSLDEPDEDFSLVLSPGMLTVVGSPGTADVTIVDDDGKSKHYYNYSFTLKYACIII